MTDLVEKWHVGLGLACFTAGVAIAVASSVRRGAGRRDSIPLAAVAVLVALVWQRLLPWPWAVAVGVLFIASGFALGHGPAPLGPLIPLVSAMSLAGLWATLPDTESPLAAAALMTPVLLCPAVKRYALSRRDLSILLALAAIVTRVGAGGRDAAVAGAICCLVWPTLGLVGGRAISTGRSARVVTIAGHAIAIAVGSRIVSPAEPRFALGVTVAVVVLSAAAAMVVLPTPVRRLRAGRQSPQ